MIKFWIGQKEKPLMVVETTWQFIIVLVIVFIVACYLEGLVTAWYQDYKLERKQGRERISNYGNSLPRFDNPPKPPNKK